jgi:hypothetical protein
MFKELVSPFQKVLLRKQMCVGCTQPLKQARILGALSDSKDFLQCKCGRRYIFDKETQSYRRASFEEEQIFLNKIKNLK